MRSRLEAPSGRERHLDDHSFTASFEYAAPVVIGLFLTSAVLALALPRTAVGEEAVADV
jgi:hypothetical protein